MDLIYSSATGKVRDKPAWEAARPVVILVAGMHRSGTSAISGVLNLLGAAITGELLGPSSDNIKGFFENKRILAFHEALLHEFGSRWEDPLPLGRDCFRSPAAQVAAQDLAALFLEEFGERPLVLVKDPRICRLLPLWIEALSGSGRNILAVLPCRHPLEVAASLRRRDGLSRPHALTLWLDHVLAAERATREIDRSVINYEDLLRDWRSVVRNVGERVGLTWPKEIIRVAGQIDEFLSFELRHHRSMDTGPLPHDGFEMLCLRAWDALKLLCSDGDSAIARATLDEVAREFEGTLRILAPLIASLDGQAIQTRHELSDREAALARAVQLAADTQARLSEEARLRGELAADTRARLGEEARLRGEAEYRRREAEREEAVARERIEGRATAAEERLAAMEGELAELHSHLAEAEQERERLRGERDSMLVSTFWRLTSPARRLATAMPRGLRLQMRRGTKLLYWVLTPYRTGQRIAYLRSRKEQALVAPATEMETSPVAQPNAESSLLAEFFDAEWYAERYPEVAASGMAPIEHYTLCGAGEGREPNPAFDTEWYLSVYPDVARGGEPAFEHFIRWGAEEGRLPFSGFDYDFYREQVGIAGASNLETYRHYLTKGPPEIEIWIDAPEGTNRPQAIPVRDSLFISGWALARAGVSSVDVTVDGDHFTSAHYGLLRWDVAAEHPEWPNAQHSGFMVNISGRSLLGGEHSVGVIIKDKSDARKEVQFLVDVAESLDESILRRKINQSEIAQQDGILSNLGWHPKFCVLMLIRGGEDELARARATLDGLREQAYSNWHLFIRIESSGEKPNGVEKSVLGGLDGISERVEILREEGELSLADLVGRLTGAVLFGLLVPGDELRRDALLQCAVATALQSEADFIYSDELRVSPVSGIVEHFLKPQWSPDLLLSTNYVGRLWFAREQLIERAADTIDDLSALGEYDLVLRLTEAAAAIYRIPETLCRRGSERLDPEAMERQAIERAMERRGIAGNVLEGCVSGIHRLKRRSEETKRVSVIIPTGSNVGLLRTCLEGLLEKTRYPIFEIILLHNTGTQPEAFPYFETLSAEPRIRIVDSKGGFNFSRICNLGGTSARGEFLLFLNDDIEVIEAEWLDALLEHAQRPEVGVVGPLLLWPDRTIQSAGVFLTNDVGRLAHAFRHTAEGDPGYFGLALTQRNVIAVTGACFLSRREVFERIGGFDEAYPVINNETDYCLKARREGFLIVYTPYSRLVHHERATRKNDPDDYDADAFKEEWGALFADGDPYHHPHLSKSLECFTPEPEPVREVYPARPLAAPDAIRNILIVKLDHIGDCITAFSALRRLKETFPHASMRVLAGHWTRPIWDLAEAIDEVIEWDFFYPRSSEGTRPKTEADLEALRQRLASYRFDLAVDLRRHEETRAILRHTGARFLAGFDHRNQFPWLDVALEWGGDALGESKRAHMADELANLVDAIAAAFEPRRAAIRQLSPVSLALSEAARRRLLGRPIVCVHAAAGDTIRQWPAEYFSELIDLLIEREGVNVALIGGPNDKAITSQVLRSVRNQQAAADLIGEIANDLRHLHNLLLECVLFVGVDSGPKHLAAELGVPTVGIHSAHLDAREYGPVGPRAFALTREMKCGPCYLRSAEDCPRKLACLTGLRPGQVYAACRKLLAGREGNIDAGMLAEVSPALSPP